MQYIIYYMFKIFLCFVSFIYKKTSNKLYCNENYYVNITKKNIKTTYDLFYQYNLISNKLTSFNIDGYDLTKKYTEDEYKMLDKINKNIILYIILNNLINPNIGLNNKLKEIDTLNYYMNNLSDISKINIENGGLYNDWKIDF